MRRAGAFRRLRARRFRAARPANEVAYPIAVSYDDYEGQRAVREQNPVSDATIARVNGFAYRSADALLPDAQGNANYSPLSLYYALALLCEGAEGETRAELAEALTGAPDGTPGEELGNLMRRLYTDDGNWPSGDCQRALDARGHAIWHGVLRDCRKGVLRRAVYAGL